MAAEIFGNDNKEGTGWATGGQVNACKFTSGSAGTLTKMSVYVGQFPTHTPHMRCHLYDAARNKVANGETEELLLGAGQDGWMHFDFLVPPTVTATTVYWLAWMAGDTGSAYMYRGTGAANQVSATAATYPTWPVTLGAGNTPWVLSIYATYEIPPQPPTEPTALQVDGKSTPVGANCVTATPLFTAIFNDPDAGDISNAIEIEVGTASDQHDMWDSVWLEDATAEGARCSAKTYAGSALSAGTSYWWCCRFRDDEGAEGAWSDWQQFDVCAAAVVAAAEAGQGGLLSQIW